MTTSCCGGTGGHSGVLFCGAPSTQSYTAWYRGLKGWERLDIKFQSLQIMTPTDDRLELPVSVQSLPAPYVATHEASRTRGSTTRFAIAQRHSRGYVRSYLQRSYVATSIGSYHAASHTMALDYTFQILLYSLQFFYSFSS